MMATAKSLSLAWKSASCIVGQPGFVVVLAAAAAPSDDAGHAGQVGQAGEAGEAVDIVEPTGALVGAPALAAPGLEVLIGGLVVVPSLAGELGFPVVVVAAELGKGFAEVADPALAAANAFALGPELGALLGAPRAFGVVIGLPLMSNRRLLVSVLFFSLMSSSYSRTDVNVSTFTESGLLLAFSMSSFALSSGIGLTVPPLCISLVPFLLRMSAGAIVVWPPALVLTPALSETTMVSLSGPNFLRRLKSKPGSRRGKKLPVSSSEARSQLGGKM